jgi:hypothetical protein
MVDIQVVISQFTNEAVDHNEKGRLSRASACWWADTWDRQINSHLSVDIVRVVYPRLLHCVRNTYY